MARPSDIYILWDFSIKAICRKFGQEKKYNLSVPSSACHTMKIFGSTVGEPTGISGPSIKRAVLLVLKIRLV
jgi:hypothetical protein